MSAPRQPAADGADRAIVRARDPDSGVLSQVIAGAFVDLAPCQWLIGDPHARRAILPGYFRMHVGHAMADGAVYTTAGRAAAALWIPAGPEGPGQPSGYGDRLAQVTGQWVERFAVFDQELEAHHLTGVAHHHLAILAVRPDLQGQGIGTALLDTHHAILDEEGIVAYLEASDERTRSLYLRHGYVDYGSPIQLSGGPLMYPMWRPARGGERGRRVATSRSSRHRTLDGHTPDELNRAIRADWESAP